MVSALVPKAGISSAPRRITLAPLMGRDETLERIAGEFAGGGTRIVTLTGPPGIGKTRAAMGCLERLAPRFSQGGGARFCDLSSVTTDGGLGLAVLSSLRGGCGGEHTGHEEAIARVGEVCESIGPTLLVLDNFEQIVSAARIVERWCEVAPELFVLVTSRERLAVAGEVVIDLPPLGCPVNDDEQAISESPAVQLFLKRARDAGVVHDDLVAVAAIVRHLEGIPLAIELAAARTRLMSPRELADRLTSNDGFLARTTRRDGGRHATLASAVAWSWDMLSPREQAALARCSVFAGSFGLDVAERIVADPDAVELLAGLRDKSLIRTTGEGRLALYVSIRDFAAARLRELSPSAAYAARFAHARAFGEMARGFNQWREMLPDTRGARAALRLEKENLAAAIAFVRGLAPDGELAVLHADLVVAASQLHALPAEVCLAELSHALEALGENDVMRHGLVLLSRQFILASLGDHEAALSDLTALETMPHIPSELQLFALVYQGVQLRHSGSPQRAWATHERAAKALQQAHVPRINAINEACMGRLQFDLGDHEASRRYNQRAMAIADSLGDHWLGALALANLAQLEQEGQSFERAHELLSSALERLRTLGGVYEAVYSSACGDLFFEWGKHDLAREWYAEGVRALRGSLLAPKHAALATASCAALEAHDGHHARARALLESARRIARSAPNRVLDVAIELHAASVVVLGAEGAVRAAAAERWRSDLERYSNPSDVVGAIVATSFEARFALRIARRMLELPFPTGPSPRRVSRSASLRSGVRLERVADEPKRAEPSCVRVDRNGRWFETDGVRVDLARRGALRRILVTLAVHHATHRDQGIKQGDLALAGWPGEHILVDAAATRVRVAIATLRELGLRSLLLTRDDGYVLDPDARVELSD